jgi:hypothetical protein
MASMVMEPMVRTQASSASEMGLSSYSYQLDRSSRYDHQAYAMMRNHTERYLHRKCPQEVRE